MGRLDGSRGNVVSWIKEQVRPVPDGPHPAACHKKEKLWICTEGLAMDDDELFKLLKGDGATRDQAIFNFAPLCFAG